MKNLLLTALLLFPTIASAAPATSVQEEMKPEPRLFSPMMTDIFLVLCFVICFILIGAVIYLYMQNQNYQGYGKKITAISRDLKAAIQELHNINAYLFPSKDKEEKKTTPKPVEPPEPPKETNAPKPVKKEVWQEFIDAYNNLANSMEVPKADIACDNFIKEHNLTLFKLVSKTVGQPPVFSEDEKDAAYWGYKIPNDDRFAIVISPKIKFDDNFYKEGGLKESFASNFEELKEIRKVAVKIPAIMTKKDGKYSINQPGLLRFS